jgi:hypothetical protein
MFQSTSFLTLQAAEAYRNAIGKNTLIPTPGTALIGSGLGAPRMPKITDPLQAIGDFFSKLGQANTWIRVGEVLLGIILLAVGAARITHAENFVSKAVGHTPAGRIAKLI